MKILLINPPVWNDLGSQRSFTPPLGLLYLAAYVEKNGYPDIRIIDADAAKMSWDDLKKYLIQERPDVVGITGTSLVIPALIKTAVLSRENIPQCIIVTGGYGATNEPARILKTNPGLVDFIVMGEGELTFLELLRALRNKVSDFTQIQGLAFLKDDQMFITPRRPDIKELDQLPWPAYHLLYPHLYDYSGMHTRQKEIKMPMLVMIASRGCPHHCTFCSLASKVYRPRNPKKVVEEMIFYRNHLKVKSIQLYDDEFIGMSPAQNEWVKNICHELEVQKAKGTLTFLVQGRCSQFIDLETLKIMKEHGFVWIWWGVESGSQKVLDSIKKDIQVENVIRDLKLARAAGIKSMIFIMIGFPGETPADIKLTAELIKKVKPDQVRIHIVTPYPGSALRKYLEENNLLETKDDYKFDTRTEVVHHTFEMSADEIKKYYRLLLFKFENGYWYFIKFLIKSLLTSEGWKKIPKRIKTAFNHFFSWLKMRASL